MKLSWLWAFSQSRKEDERYGVDLSPRPRRILYRASDPEVRCFLEEELTRRSYELVEMGDCVVSSIVQERPSLVIVEGLLADCRGWTGTDFRREYTATRWVPVVRICAQTQSLLCPFVARSLDEICLRKPTTVSALISAIVSLCPSVTSGRTNEGVIVSPSTRPTLRTACATQRQTFLP